MTITRCVRTQKSAVLKNTKKIYNTTKKYAGLLRHTWKQFLLQEEYWMKEKITIIDHNETLGLQSPESYITRIVGSLTRIPQWRSIGYTLQKKPSNFRIAAAKH